MDEAQKGKRPRREGAIRMIEIWAPSLSPSGAWNLREPRGFEALEAGICDSCEELRRPRREGAIRMIGIWALSLPPPLAAGICESYEDLKLWRLEFATVARICCEALDQGTTVGVKLVRGGPHGRVAGVCSCAPACSSQNENPPSREWWE